MCVMAREDEVENEQEVAKPTEAEAAGDEEYVEDVVEEEVDDGKVRVIRVTDECVDFSPLLFILLTCFYKLIQLKLLCEVMIQLFYPIPLLPVSLR